MNRRYRVWLCALSLLSGLWGPAAEAQSPGAQSAAAIWVASHGTASLRLGRGVVAMQVERAARVLLPYESDHRFELSGSSIRHLPHKNLIEITTQGVAHVPFVQDKQVRVTVQIRPEIYAEGLRLRYVGMRHSIERCEVEGPICFMLKRAIDQHVADGSQIQAFLDDGLNAALRPVFRAAMQTACRDGRVLPARVTTAPEFLEVLMAARAEDVACLRRSQGASLPADLGMELKPGHAGRTDRRLP